MKRNDMVATIDARDDAEHADSAGASLEDVRGTDQRAASVRNSRALPLVAILGVTVVMSARSLGATAPSGEEAFNIYAGHQILYALLHGGASPRYQVLFSGAPGVYPPLSALAASIGGLAAARALSLAFVLVATTLAYASVRRIFGYWPAISSSGLFAILAVSEFVASRATYDALALALIAVAVFCTVRSSESPAGTAKWLLLIPVTLTAANLTAYYTLLFDPIVIVLGALLIGLKGRSFGARRLVAMSASTGILLIAAFFLIGTSYLKGVLVGLTDKQLFGSTMPAGPRQIVMHSAAWLGAIVALGLLGVLLAAVSKRERRYCGILVLLTAAGLLATASGVMLHSLTALAQHDDVGAWFAVIPAGYSLGRAAEMTRRASARAVLVSVSACVLTACGVVGYTQVAASAVVQHPALARVRVLDEYIRPRGHYLIANYPSIIYYLRPQPRWWQVVDGDDVSFPLPGIPGRYLSGTAGFEEAIRDHWFAVISFLPFNSHPLGYWERLELEWVSTTPGYVLVSTSGGLTFIDKYRYEPARSSSGKRRSHA